MKNKITENHKECAKALFFNPEIPEQNGVLEDVSRIIAAHFPEPMDEQKARAVLGDWIGRGPKMNERLFGKDRLGWRKGMDCACLTGYFTAEQLEAIIWWMRNMGK